MPVGVAPKSKVVAALLFFFLGSFGIGNFYMGQTNTGIAKLVLCFIAFVLTFVFIGIFLYMAIGIWAFVEMIFVLTGSNGYDRDANGVPLV
nr:TM2 domain-containing protein [Corynebacterium aquatimens]